MDLLEHLLDLGSGLALDGLGHHRGRGLGDGAALALEADVANHAVGDIEVNGHVIATQGIGALGAPVGGGHGREVARVALVVEDDFLIKVVERVHGRNILWASPRQETNVSISSRLL